jgi:hypothetical protein
MPLNIQRNRKTISFYEDRSIGEQVTAAELALAEAKGGTGADKRLASKAVREAQNRLDEVKGLAEATVLEVTLTALKRKEWNETEDRHPPREGKDTDKLYGVNIDTLFHEVLPKSVLEVRQKATGEVRTDITPEDWIEALDEIDEGQFSVIALAILQVNRNTENSF